ncbi:MAG: oligosaccharide flippase family protein [Terriglobales bacterium]
MKQHRIVLLGSALSVVSVVVTTVVGFFLMPFLVHGLGDRMYGYWALVGAVLGFYGILDLGISPAVAFQLAKAIGKGDGESPNRTLSTAVVAFSVLGLIALAITAVVAACCQWFIANPADVGVFRAVLVIMGLGFALGFPGRAFMGGVYAHLRNDLIALVAILGLILRTSLIVVVLMKGKGLIGLALVSLITEGAMYLANYLILRKVQKGLRISFALADKDVFKELLHYGGYSVVIRVGDQLRFAVDSWMVAAFVGLSAVAHYTIASRLSAYFLTFIVSAVGLLQSWFSQLLGSQDYVGIRKMLTFGTKIACALSTIVMVSFILYGRVFISEWMGPFYVDAYWPSVILIAALFCDLAQQPSVAYLMGVSRHRYLAFQTLGEGVANLLLSMHWARRYGMVGVSLGTLVPMVVAKLLLQPAYVCRHAGIPLRGYYVKVLGNSALVPALCGFAMWRLLFHNLYLLSLWRVCAIVVVQGLLCALGAYFFVLDREDRHRLVSKLLPRRSMKQDAADSAVLPPELITQRVE